MSRRRAIVLLAAGAGLALLALRGCDEDATPATPEAVGSAPAPASTPARGDDGQDAARAQAELVERRHRALRAAVSTVHRYLAALPGEDRAAADAFWVDGEPPRDADEADLRALPAPPTFFRTRNRTPEALDRAPVPAAVCIPVALRLGLEGRPLQRYEGWYELRRGDGDEDWAIASASIDAIPNRQ